MLLHSPSPKTADGSGPAERGVARKERATPTRKRRAGRDREEEEGEGERGSITERNREKRLITDQ